MPYDYLTLTFSPSYLESNLVLAWKTGLPLIATGGVALVLAGWSPPGRRSDARSLIEFLLLGTGPMTLFYLFYFFPHSRFFLSALVVSALLLGSVVGARIDRLPRGVLLVANKGDATLGIIDANTLGLQTIPIGANDHSVAVDPVSGEVFVATASTSAFANCANGCIGVISPTAVPEPGSLPLVAIALAALGFVSMRRRSR